MNLKPASVVKELGDALKPSRREVIQKEEHVESVWLLCHHIIVRVKRFFVVTYSKL